MKHPSELKCVSISHDAITILIRQVNELGTKQQMFFQSNALY